MEDQDRIIKSLRSIPTIERILNNVRRVNIFSYDSIISRLSLSPEQLNTILNDLLANNVLVKIRLQNDNECSVFLSKKTTKDDYFMFVKEESNHFTLFISVLVILAALSLAMFQLWPSKIRYYASFSIYPLSLLIVLVIVVAIIRLIVFCITYFTHPPGLWLLPNLFLDTDFYNTIFPLYAYAGQDTRPEKKYK